MNLLKQKNTNIPVAVLSDSGTLTFYFDERDHSCEGTVYDLRNFNLTWRTQCYSAPWADADIKIKTAIFDRSFAGYCPLSTKGWFAGCVELDTIKGIQNLNTCHTTDMSWMFAYCRSLKELDVNELDTSSVVDMQSMLYTCSNLEKLSISKLNTDHVETVNSMFWGCDNLNNACIGRNLYLKLLGCKISNYPIFQNTIIWAPAAESSETEK